jgi:hypothetical protein
MVLNPSYVESGNRSGLVYPLNSFLFHDSSKSQVKFLKGTEEKQVKRNVLFTQCTVDEQLGRLSGSNSDSVIIVVTLSNLKWMRKNSCQTIMQWAVSDQYSDMYIQTISPTYTCHIHYIYHIHVHTCMYIVQ